MSGDATATGRTCLLPGEVDPAGQATLCVTPKPVVIDTIPTVGVSALGFIIPMVLGIAIACLLIAIDMRVKRKMNQRIAATFKRYLGKDE